MRMYGGVVDGSGAGGGGGPAGTPLSPPTHLFGPPPPSQGPFSPGSAALIAQQQQQLAAAAAWMRGTPGVPLQCPPQHPATPAAGPPAAFSFPPPPAFAPPQQAQNDHPPSHAPLKITSADPSHYMVGLSLSLVCVCAVTLPSYSSMALLQSLLKTKHRPN